MRAVLDRPLTSNFVTVSTALNRVAKLAAERSPAGLATQKERKCLGTLLEVTEELVASDMVNARNLAQLLWSLAKLGNPEVSEGLVKRHPEAGLREIGPLKFGASGRGNAAGAEGTPKQGGRLPALIAGKLSERACECKPVELAMAAWGLAVLGERDEACLSSIAEEVRRRAHTFQGQELGNIVWAFAVLEYRDKAMLDAVAEVLSPEPLQWTGRVCWEWKDTRFTRGGGVGTWQASIDRSWEASESEEPQRPAAEVAATVAAEAAAAALVAKTTAGPTDGDATNSDVTEAITTADVISDGNGLRNKQHTADEGARAMSEGPDGTERGLFGAGYGGAEFGGDRRRWSCEPQVEVSSVLMTPQDLATLAWGFSALSHEWAPEQPAAYRALAVLAKAARRCVGRFRPQDLSMVSLALARLSWDDPELMGDMTTRATEKLRAFKPQELSNMAWACARLYVQDSRFWAALQTQATIMLAGPGMKAQEIANLAWSLAVMGEANSVLLANLLRAAQAQRNELTVIECHQLYQVYLLWGKDMPDLWRDLGDDFLLELEQRWTSNQERMKRSSFSHLEVSKTLELMQVSHENESEHDIDIEVVGVGLASEDWDFRSFATGAGPNPADPAKVRLKVALEVDGPAHFTKNTARPLGHMLLKHRTLTKMGWTVVSIPFLEWDPIPFWSSMEKKRYLQRKLGITRTIFFGGIDCSKYKGWSTRMGKTSRYH